MKSLSFVHLADLHLGYTQYNLPERREDFSRVFVEAVDRTLELKPDFAILAGDIFDSPRPSNQTLATAVRELRRLREAGVKVFATDGSHDMEPNVMTGTVLTPLHNAGLICYLPRLEGSAFRGEDYYIYGLPGSRSLMEADGKFPSYLKDKPPKPEPSAFNILVFHGALDDPRYSPPYFKPDIRVDHLPSGFQYYAGGHIHEPKRLEFKGGLLAYPGCLETTDYSEAAVEKGFYHVRVEAPDAVPRVERISVEKARRFIVEERDYSGMTPKAVFQESSNLLASLDSEGAVVVFLLKGQLPPGYRKSEVDVHGIRSSAPKALHTMVLNQMTEAELAEEDVFRLKEARELKTLAYRYLFEYFRHRYPGGVDVKMAKIALELLDPLIQGEEGKVKTLLEEAVEGFPAKDEGSKP
ncbi:DNA repair exonuclease [Candidatus Hecatella orcuttiae]|uniref:metallophosphoesterase family protein n=1 Tax=Candidatus Hecatella orcuttiae TaxID=1935119 RepID=UPI0028681397|nr:DNA repair exonuclease [Candidatus Hecatella orcuttiae]